MKKIIAVILIFMLVFVAAACGDNSVSEEELSQIHEVGTAPLAIDGGKLNHQNTISISEKRLNEELTGHTKDFHLFAKTYNLTYDTTINYPARDYKVNQYKIEGTDEGVISFREDGTFYSYTNYYDPMCVIDIKETDSSETVRAALEPAISKIVDVSKYEFVDVEASLSIEESGRFGMYIFYYYNAIQGYCSDVTMISVKDNGYVVGISIDDLNLEATSIGTISKEREDALILAKLKDMSDTDVLEYRSHKIRKSSTSPQFTMFEGELCIQYTVSCEIYDTGLEDDRGFACRLLIPVRLLVED